MTETSVQQPISTMSRVQHIAYLTVPPGGCTLCTKATHEDGFADPNIHIEWHGAVVFCRDCVAEMAALWRFVGPEVYRAMENALNQQEQELAELKTSVTNLEQQVDSLSYERLRSRGLLDLPANRIAISEASQEQSSSVDELTSSTDELLASLIDAGTEESTESVESVDEQGPDDVSESTDNNELGQYGL